MTATRRRIGTALGAVLTAAFAAAAPARAHCDALDGPVVREARLALEADDVTRVLKWIRPEDERDVREAFARASRLRGAGAEARDLAQTWFFETLVRLHRAGEGAAYTGLKPAGLDPGPAIRGADQALAAGSADALVTTVLDEAAEGIRSRFRRALDLRKDAATNVEAGRAYVAAYVEFVHHVERLHAAARGGGADHATAPDGHEQGR
jgi:hypothetical protein